MTSSSRSLFDYPEAFRNLAEKENLQRQELLSSIESCARAAHEVPAGQEREKVGAAVRSIFTSTQDIFFKLQTTLSPHDQAAVLTFASVMVTMVPSLPQDVLRGLEALVIKVSAAAMPLFEALSMSQKDGIKLFYFLQPLTVALEKIDMASAPILQVVDLFMRCTRLFVRNLARCDKEVFIDMNMRLIGVAKKLGEMGGMGLRVLNLWKTLLAECTDENLASDDYVQRLLCSIGGCLASLSTCSAFHLTVEAGASMRDILSALDRMTAMVLQSGRTPEDKKIFFDLRKSALLGASLLYPPALIERYRFRDVPVDASLEEIIHKACVGLERADPERTPEELLVAYHCAIVAFIAQQSGAFLPEEFRKNEASVVKVTRRWQLSLASFRKSCLFVFAEIETLLRAPNIPFHKLQNLLELGCRTILELKRRPESIDPQTAKAFFTTASAFIDAFVRIPRFEEEQKEPIKNAQKGLIGAVLDAHFLQPASIQPTFIFDWFDKIPEAIAIELGVVMVESLRALQEVRPGNASPQYARSQLLRTLSFIIHNQSKMSDKEFCYSFDRFMTVQQSWAGLPEIVLGVIRTWAKELLWVLEQYLSAERTGTITRKEHPVRKSLIRSSSFGLGSSRTRSTCWPPI